jgi:hypothetical protein
MKKKQCVIAISCLIAGLIGFGGVYATERAAQKRQEEQIAEQQEVMEDAEQSESVSGVIEPQTTAQSAKLTVEDQSEPQVEIQSEAEVKTESELEADANVSPDLETIDRYVEETAEDMQEEAVEETIEEMEPQETFADTLHFSGEDSPVWPLEGEVLLDYSAVNSKVYLIAKGIITDISTNEVTGCTVTEDLGDGYEAVYGQLKELNFSVGDEVEGGQVIGYISEPTKYYSVEGSNLYFELLKDGEPVNPLEYFD